jgi:hypothetical protein
MGGMAGHSAFHNKPILAGSLTKLIHMQCPGFFIYEWDIANLEICSANVCEFLREQIKISGMIGQCKIFNICRQMHF